jgi:hypothetical protein
MTEAQVTNRIGLIEDLYEIIIYVDPSDMVVGRIPIPRAGYRMGQTASPQYFVLNVATMQEELISDKLVLLRESQHFGLSLPAPMRYTSWGGAREGARDLQRKVDAMMLPIPPSMEGLPPEEIAQNLIAAIKIAHDLKRKREGEEKGDLFTEVHKHESWTPLNEEHDRLRHKRAGDVQALNTSRPS